MLYALVAGRPCSRSMPPPSLPACARSDDLATNLRHLAKEVAEAEGDALLLATMLGDKVLALE